MLIQLEIQNFAIIEQTIINFDKGLNVLSGKTGAGKSILFDAISAILGERTSKNSIRKGADCAVIKAVFLKTNQLVDVLAQHAIEVTDDYIIVERQINKNGRSFVKLNQSMQTTQVIKDVCASLVEICGQRAHQALLKDDHYLSYLDHLGNEDHQQQRQQYDALYAKWRTIGDQIKALLANEREKEQLLDLYRFQKEEIEEAKLTIGEDEALEEEKQFLASFEKISTHVHKAMDSLGAVQTIYTAKQELMEAAKYDPNLLEQAERLEKVYYEMEDVQQDVNHYMDHVEYDEARLNEVMIRLEDINKLKRKYADTIEGILSYYEEIQAKVDAFDHKEEHVATLEKEKKQVEITMKSVSEALHVTRVALAKIEEEKIVAQLNELCMPDAAMSFRITQSDTFLKDGTTCVSLWFSANKGEDMQPLAKVASGGEMSRVLLAMKIASTQHDQVPTILFDEVDEGVGGEEGRVIGHKLEKLGQSVQVICISHLPQVAARGDHHFLIEKKIEEERTVSHVRKLQDTERKEEIARMIYGDEGNETTLKQAEEMLRKN